jgi:integrase
MHTKDSKKEGSEGTVSLESCQGRLRLRFRVNGQRYALALGLPDTAENRKSGEVKARQIELDILSDSFDPTLAKYKPHTYLTLIKPTEQLQKALTLVELWDKYTEYRKPQLAAKTLAWYTTFTNHIAKFPTQSLDEAVAIRDYILANLPADMGKRLLVRINACCKWALQSGLIFKNPFESMAQSIKVEPKDEADIDPFTAEERDAIIEAFESHREYKKYASFVKFLFHTGCRPSEAIGLRWKHISPNLSVITFSEAIVLVSGQKVQKASTKTNKPRKFPVNQKLKALLESVKPEQVNPEDLVFPLPNGKPIDWNHFSRAWKGGNNGHKKYLGIVTQLVDRGKIDHYRNPYQTRHTFVTLALQNGLTIPDVARLIGNSPQICLKHYASSRRNLQVPEF